MSQNDFNIANQGFPSFRSDLNSALQALASCSSGSAAPTTTYANMLWMDTANNKLKVRNEDNDAWIDLFDLNQTADTAMLAGVTATVAELNVLAGITSSTAELNILDGVTLTAAQLNATGQLAGRNRIINGQGRINQRGYTSGTATSGANEYTLDRWRVVTSGQSLTFTGDDSKRTMTAPAGGVEQVIEGANIEGGTYVLNWTGTATATVGGAARTKGETFTLSANTNVTVRFTSGTFTDVQLELGSTPTTFERLTLGDELARCQRYYEIGSYQFGSAATDASGISYGRVYFKTTKRSSSYSVSRTDQILTNALASVVGDLHIDGFDIQASGAATGSLMRVRGIYTVDNEP